MLSRENHKRSREKVGEFKDTKTSVSTAEELVKLKLGHEVNTSQNMIQDTSVFQAE